MSKKNDMPTDMSTGAKRRKAVEMTATFGLLLVCAALIAPFATSEGSGWMPIFKYIYAAGALIFIIARIVGGTDRSESLRLRRLRRLEAWAGVAFCVGAFFWFYNGSRFGETAFTLVVLRDTIMFTLAGAVIQIIAAWMISVRARKEAEQSDDFPDNNSDKS